MNQKILTWQEPNFDVLICVPVFENPSTFLRLAKSLNDGASEIIRNNAKVLFINDSPNHPSIKNLIMDFITNTSYTDLYYFWENPENLGFLGTVNIAIKEAADSNFSILLLNSDTVVFGDWLSQILQVARCDEKIGFVSPRSNNATIANYPPEGDTYFGHSPERCFEMFQQFSHGLPQFSFVPVANGFCLFIQNWVLKEVGFLDPIFGRGYEEENDLMLRANEFGINAVLANWAFVWHQGSVSFSNESETLKVKNHETIVERFPEYPNMLHRYYTSANYIAEMIWAALNQSKKIIIFDLSNLGPYTNGTSVMVKEILDRLKNYTNDSFEMVIYTNRQSFEYHQLGDLGARWIDSSKDQLQNAACIVRIGQIFDFNHLITLRKNCAVLIVFMLDTIAWDTQHLNSTFDPGSWSATFLLADKTPTISESAKTLFKSRFDFINDNLMPVRMLSTSSRDYRRDFLSTKRGHDYILIIGNKFRHKFVDQTVKALVENEVGSIIAIGATNVKSDLVSSHPSGKLGSNEIDILIREARFVIFPSFYEGFGLPILEVISQGVPIFVRNTSISREIRDKCDKPELILLFDDTKDLIDKIKVESFIPENIYEKKRNNRATETWELLAKNIWSDINSLIIEKNFTDLRKDLALVEIIDKSSLHVDPVRRIGSKVEAFIRHILSYKIFLALAKKLWYSNNRIRTWVFK
jgi:GT2 family glycosyltransferase